MDNRLQKIFILIMLSLVLLIAGCSEEIDDDMDNGGDVEEFDIDDYPVPEETNEVSAPENDDLEEMDKEETTKTKTFTLTGGNFWFDMNGKKAPELKVNKGDTVKIEFSANEGFHDWVIDEFNVATEKIKSGESTFVEFVATETGTFEYYCSVGSHRANGMVGNLIVS